MDIFKVVLHLLWFSLTKKTIWFLSERIQVGWNTSHGLKNSIKPNKKPTGRQCFSENVGFKF
jgi:hypothetical protein